MGIFDFLKKFRKKKEEKEPEKLSFKEIDNWIQNKKEEIKSQDNEFLNEIKKINKELIETLNEKLRIIEKVDLDEKKVEDKIRTIVKGNLENSVDNTEKLLKELKDLNEIETSNILIREINQLFLNFQKKSELSFQKSTYLVGEIGEIKEKIGVYFRNLESIISKNKYIIDISNALDQINEILKGFSEIETTKGKIDTEIETFEENINLIKNKIEGYESDIDKIKGNNEYRDEITKKENIKTQNQQLGKEIFKLRDLINFKTLSSIYHKNEKEMRVIKEYKENFSKSFQKDFGGKLKEIIESTSQIERKDAIKDRFEIILKLKDEVEQLEKIPNIFSLKIDTKKTEINNLKNEIESIFLEIKKANKRSEKTRIIESDQLEKLKIEFRKIDVEIVG